MSDRCSCPSSLFFPHRKEKCALNQILKTASHSQDESYLDQRLGVDNVDRVAGDNRSEIRNSAEALEELGNRMCNCLLARKFPHRAAKCFQASVSRVADEAVRGADEKIKADLSEKGCVAGSSCRLPVSSVSTGHIKAHSDPVPESVAYIFMNSITELSPGQGLCSEHQNTHLQSTPKPTARSSEYQNTHLQSTPKPAARSSEYQNTHQQSTPKPAARSSEYQNTHLQSTPKPAARSSEHQNTHQQSTPKPAARSSEHQNTHQQSTPKPTTHGDVSYTPGSKKNRNRSCHQNTSSSSCDVHQKSKPNADKLKAQQTRHQPAPGQTIIESTTVRTSTTYQTVTRGPK